MLEIQSYMPTLTQHGHCTMIPLWYNKVLQFKLSEESTKTKKLQFRNKDLDRRSLIDFENTIYDNSQSMTLYVLTETNKIKKETRGNT